MPRRKKQTKKKEVYPEIIEHHTPRQGITAYARSSYRWAESYTSLLMGVVIVIVAVLFVISLIRATHHIQDTSSTSTGPSPVVTQTPSHNPSIYTIKSGDDLWHIAENAYGDGNKWVEIARVNNLDNPSLIFAGNQLTLPKIEPETQGSSLPLKDTSYVVKTGDNLWSIAVSEYGDGYKWVDIARVNNLSTPDLIFSGNTLKLPR